MHRLKGFVHLRRTFLFHSWHPQATSLGIPFVYAIRQAVWAKVYQALQYQKVESCTTSCICQTASSIFQNRQFVLHYNSEGEHLYGEVLHGKDKGGKIPELPVMHISEAVHAEDTLLSE